MFIKYQDLFTSTFKNLYHKLLKGIPLENFHSWYFFQVFANFTEKEPSTNICDIFEVMNLLTFKFKVSDVIGINVFACLFSVHNIIILSRYEEVCLNIVYDVYTCNDV